MQALTYNPQASQTAHLSLTEVVKPTLTKHNAIVRVTGVGVCGSDLLKLNRGLIPVGAILGHELVGVISEISAEMSKLYNLQVGDRIVSSHHVPCLQCNYCLAGQESLCKQFKATNFNPGAFCEYLELSEAHLKYTVQKIPENLSDEESSFIEPVACCIKAIKKIKSISPYKTRNLVLGLGSIGLIMGQLVKYYYPEEQVIGCDIIPARLKLAQALGFDNTISKLDAKYDCIFLCAGSNVTVDLALRHAADGASIMVFASVEDGRKAFANNDIYYKELNVMASYSPNLSDLKESLELVIAHKIELQKLITHRSGLADLGATILRCSQNFGIKTYLEIK